jgi:NADH-quinone oxidoreductase subunit L
MYYAIAFLPLLGAIIAGLISLAGARARHPGGPPSADDHAHGSHDTSHALADPSAPAAHGTHAVEEAQPPAAGSRGAELVTTVFLFASMLLSWFAFADVGFLHHDARAALFPWMVSGDLKVEWALRIDTLTAVMLVVVTTISAFVHLYSIGYMGRIRTAPRSSATCRCSLSPC